MASILFISGSPRSGGNNEKAIEFASRIAKNHDIDIDFFFLSEKYVEPCKACEYCKSNDSCSINDDMEELFDKMKSASAIVVSSPVYFGTVSAQLKAVFDRSRVLRRHGFKLKNKIGAAFACGKSRNGGQETTLLDIHKWMHIQGLHVIGDANHYGGTIVDNFDKDKEGKKTVKECIEFVIENLP